MERITVKAFAKVNMALEIKGKRPDGYHELETLFRGITLHDSVTLKKSTEGIRLTCEGPFSGDLPCDRRNLAWQAAELLRLAFPGRIPGADIRIRKEIPAAAGLAGGSSDAAAVLSGLSRLYGLNLDKARLEGFAAQLGSDVAFCLEPLAALGRGRGEKLEPAAPGPSLWLVLVMPPFGLSAKKVYSVWKPEKPEPERGAEKPERPEPEKQEPEGPEPGAPEAAGAVRGRLAALQKGLREHNWDLIRENMFNDLEGAAFSLEKELREYKKWIEGPADGEPVDGAGGEAGARQPEETGSRQPEPETAGKVLLCGSGPALAVYFWKEAPARRLAERLRAEERPGRCRPMLFLERTLSAEDLLEGRYRYDEEE